MRLAVVWVRWIAAGRWFAWPPTWRDLATAWRDRFALERRQSNSTEVLLRAVLQPDGEDSRVQLPELPLGWAAVLWAKNLVPRLLIGVLLANPYLVLRANHVALRPGKVFRPTPPRSDQPAET